LISRWCPSPLTLSAWLLIHALASIADVPPSAFGGFARSASSRSFGWCAYHNAMERCCVAGLELARARGVVVLGLGESFAGPRSLPTTMTHSRAMHLLEGVAARSLPPLDLQVLLGCWPVVVSPTGCCFGASEVCWRG
jgi:hypothetical protein